MLSLVVFCYFILFLMSIFECKVSCLFKFNLFQSEEYEHDFTCLGLFRHDTKLLAGSSKGTMYLFNWGEFGLHSDEFTGFKQPVSCLVPVTETVAITGWEDGKLRQVFIPPFWFFSCR